jgi:hypothetical protein
MFKKIIKNKKCLVFLVSLSSQHAFSQTVNFQAQVKSTDPKYPFTTVFYSGSATPGMIPTGISTVANIVAFIYERNIGPFIDPKNASAPSLSATQFVALISNPDPKNTDPNRKFFAKTINVLYKGSTPDSNTQVCIDKIRHLPYLVNPNNSSTPLEKMLPSVPATPKAGQIRFVSIQDPLIGVPGPNISPDLIFTSYFRLPSLLDVYKIENLTKNPADVMFFGGPDVNISFFNVANCPAYY